MSEIRAGYKQTEVGVIPEDWECDEIGDFIDLVTGFPFPSSGYSQSGTRLLRGSNVKRNCTDWSEDLVQHWPSITADIRKYLLNSGDIVIAMDGSLVGRSFASLNDDDVPALLLQRVARIRTKNVSQSYLRMWVCSSRFTTHCDLVKTTTAIPHISPGDIRTFKVAIPPTKAEQEAIAEALSDADALIESLEQLLAKKRHLKQGAMQELLTGKKRLPGFSGEWAVKLLGEECELVTKGTTPTSLGKDFVDSGINFIKVESLDQSGNILLDMIAFIDVETNSLLKRSQLKEHDILVSIAGALGRSGVVDVSILPANTNQALAIVRLKRNSVLHWKYVYFVLGFEEIKRHIDSISAQGAQANLSLQQVADFPIHSPSFEEQEAIAEILSNIDAEIAELESQLAKTHALKQGMMQKLLTGEIRLI